MLCRSPAGGYMLSSGMGGSADSPPIESQLVIAMLAPDKAERLRSAVPIGVRLEFVRSEAEAFALHKKVARAKAIVIDATLCGPRGAGTKLVEPGAHAGVPIVPLLSLNDAAVEDAFAALRTGAVDIVFDPPDTIDRCARALGVCNDRRWPMHLASKLEPELLELSTELGLVCFAIL